MTGRVITEADFDENYDFHPYSYYEEDPAPSEEIGRIFNLEKGAVQSSKREEGEYDFITASDTWLTHNEYTHDCEALIFVFGAGGSLGKVHYVNGKFVTSDLCYVLTPKNPKKVNLKYYYAYFNSRRKDIVRRLARGTNKKAINDIGPLFGMWFQSMLMGIITWVLTICIFIVVYGRMIEIYMVTSVAPIPMASMMNREWGQMGQNYLRSLFALGFQAFLIMVCVAIYATLVQNIAITDDVSSAVWTCIGYTVLLCFTLFKTSSLAKSVFNAH